MIVPALTLPLESSNSLLLLWYPCVRYTPSPIPAKGSSENNLPFRHSLPSLHQGLVDLVRLAMICSLGCRDDEDQPQQLLQPRCLECEV